MHYGFNAKQHGSLRKDHIAGLRSWSSVASPSLPKTCPTMRRLRQCCSASPANFAWLRFPGFTAKHSPLDAFHMLEKSHHRPICHRVICSAVDETSQIMLQHRIAHSARTNKRARSRTHLRVPSMCPNSANIVTTGKLVDIPQSTAT